MNLYHDIYGYLRTLVFEDLRVSPSRVAYFYDGKLEGLGLYPGLGLDPVNQSHHCLNMGYPLVI